MTESSRLAIVLSVALAITLVGADTVIQKDSTTASECPADNEGDVILIPHESKCNSFYICNHGQKEKLTCPDGLVFNPDTKVCDWPRNVACIGSIADDSSDSDSSAGDSSNLTETDSASSENSNENSDSNSSDEIDNESANNDSDEGSSRPTETVPVSSEGSDSGEAESVPIIPTENCPVNDEGDPILSPHETDCSLYYTCEGGQKVVLACPENLAFNPLSNECDWPEIVGCTLGGTDDSDSSDSGSTDSSSSREIESSTIVNTEESSEENSNDDSDSSSSEEIEDESATSNSDESTTETVPVTSEDSGSGEAESVPIIPIDKCPANDGSDPILSPHESDCGLFYTCDNGQKVVMACPDGLAFNPVSKECDWPEIVGCTPKSTDDSGSSDSGITDSSNSKEIESSTIVNSEENSDDDSDSNSSEEIEDESATSDSDEGISSSTETVPVSSEGSGSDEAESVPIIPIDKCPANNEGDPILSPHESDCGLFYTCDNGQKVLMTCPEGLAFNPVSNACDWPEIVGCTPGSTDDSDSSDSGITDSSNSTEIESSTIVNSEENSEEDSNDSSDSNSSEEIEDESATSDSDESISSSTEPVPVSAEGSGSDEAESVPIIPTDKCPVNSEGNPVFSPHETDCGLYYTCDRGQKVLNACPENLAFNPLSNECDWPEVVGCTPGGTEDSDSSDSSVTDSSNSREIESSTIVNSEENGNDDSDSSSSEEIEDESATSDSDENIPSSTETVPVTSEGSGSGEAESVPIIPIENCPVNNEGDPILSPHESDCGLFYTCDRGQKVLLECPEGLAFNPLSNECDWPEIVGCIPGGTDDFDSSDSSVTDSSDSREIESSTIENSDSNSSEEIDDESATTDSNESTSSSTESVPVSSEGSGSDEAESVPIIPTDKCPVNSEGNPVFSPHESDCGLYYTCDRGQKVLLECPGGLAFNPLSNECDWPEIVGCTPGGTEDSDGSDSSITDSSNSSEIESSTIVNSEENSSSEEIEDESATSDSDESISSSTETVPVTSEASGSDEADSVPIKPIENCPVDDEGNPILSPHESDCGLYYTCDRGQKVLLECPAGLAFNPLSKECDWPEIVGCTPGNTEDSDSSDSSVTDSSNSSEIESSTIVNSEEDSSSEEIEDESTTSDSDESISSSTETVPVTSEGSGSDEAESVPIKPIENCPVNNEGDPILSPHESDCGLFYTCDNGQKVVLECPEGLAFNPVSKECDWPEIVGCTPGNTDDWDSSDSGITDSSTSREIESSTIVNSEENSEEDSNDNSDSNSSEEIEDESATSDSDEGISSSTETVPVTSEDSGSDEADSVPIKPIENCPVDNEGNPILSPHESDCGLFYTCDRGQKVLLACPAGLAFNPLSKECDWPEIVGCTPGSTDDSSSSESSVTNSPDSIEIEWSTSESTDTSTDSSEIEWSSDESSNNHSDESDSGETGSDSSEGSDSNGSDANSPTECPATNDGGLVHIAHESDCSLFYVCNHGNKVEMQCSKGLHFNADLQVCDWPESAGCTLGSSNDSSDASHSAEHDSDNSEGSDSDSTEDSNIIPTECPADNKGDVVHIAHESDCTQFYTCNHGSKVQTECPAGLHFNPSLQVCDWPESAGCTSGSSDDSRDVSNSAEHDSDHSGGSDSDNSEDSDSDNSEGSDSDSTEVQSSIPTECPADNEGGVVHIAHESDCNKFYTCNHGSKIQMSCSAGLHFNAASQVCDWPASAGCTVDNSGNTRQL